MADSESLLVAYSWGIPDPASKGVMSSLETDEFFTQPL